MEPSRFIQIPGAVENCKQVCCVQPQNIAENAKEHNDHFSLQ